MKKYKNYIFYIFLIFFCSCKKNAPKSKDYEFEQTNKFPILKRNSPQKTYYNYLPQGNEKVKKSKEIESKNEKFGLKIKKYYKKFLAKFEAGKTKEKTNQIKENKDNKDKKSKKKTEDEVAEALGRKTDMKLKYASIGGFILFTMGFLIALVGYPIGAFFTILGLGVMLGRSCAELHCQKKCNQRKVKKHKQKGKEKKSKLKK